MWIWQLVELAHHHVVVLLYIVLLVLLCSKVRLHHPIWPCVVHVDREVDWLEELDAVGVIRRLKIHAGVLFVRWRRAEDALIVADASRVPLVTDVEADAVHASPVSLIHEVPSPRVVRSKWIVAFVGTHFHHLPLMVLPRHLRGRLLDDVETRPPRGLPRWSAGSTVLSVRLQTIHIEERRANERVLLLIEAEFDAAEVRRFHIPVGFIWSWRIKLRFLHLVDGCLILQVSVSCDTALALQEDAVLHVQGLIAAIHGPQRAHLRIAREVFESIVLVGRLLQVLLQL